MKKFILLACVLGLYTANAQKFKETEQYTIVQEQLIGQEEEGMALMGLVASDDTSKTITLLNIVELELLEEVHITRLSNPGLKDISEILKVELEYAACCSSTETYYFLVTDANDFIALPRIENVYCDMPQSDEHYIFPSQMHGQEGMIVKVEMQYTKTHTIKDIKVLQSFAWNDDDFDYEDALTAIN